MADPTVKGIIDWALRGGAAVIAYYILAKAQGKLCWLKDDIMFYATCATTGVLGVGFWLLGMWLGYINVPGSTAQDWVIGGGSVVITIFIGSQFIYSQLQLRLKRVDPVAYTATFNKSSCTPIDLPVTPPVVPTV